MIIKILCEGGNVNQTTVKKRFFLLWLSDKTSLDQIGDCNREIELVLNVGDVNPK